MRMHASFILTIILICHGCPSSSFIRTGTTYPLPSDTSQVQVLLGEKRPENYIELGSVRLDGSEDRSFGEFVFTSYDRFVKAVEAAKKIARQNGGIMRRCFA